MNKKKTKIKLIQVKEDVEVIEDAESSEVEVMESSVDEVEEKTVEEGIKTSFLEVKTEILNNQMKKPKLYSFNYRRWNLRTKK